MAVLCLLTQLRAGEAGGTFPSAHHPGCGGPAPPAGDRVPGVEFGCGGTPVKGHRRFARPLREDGNFL